MEKIIKECEQFCQGHEKTLSKKEQVLLDKEVNSSLQKKMA